MCISLFEGKQQVIMSFINCQCENEMGGNETIQLKHKSKNK